MTSYVLRLYDDPLLRFDASYGEGLLEGKVEAHICWLAISAPPVTRNRPHLTR